MENNDKQSQFKTVIMDLRSSSRHGSADADADAGRGGGVRSDAGVFGAFNGTEENSGGRLSRSERRR